MTRRAVLLIPARHLTRRLEPFVSRREYSLRVAATMVWLTFCVDNVSRDVVGIVNAKTRMDAIRSVTIYSGDSDEWSNSAMRDIVWYLRKFGRRRPRYIRNGEWVRAKLSEVLAEKDGGSPIGRCLFSMSCLPEMAELLGGFRVCDGALLHLSAGPTHSNRWIIDRAAASSDGLRYSENASSSPRALLACWRILRR